MFRPVLKVLSVAAAALAGILTGCAHEGTGGRLTVPDVEPEKPYAVLIATAPWCEPCKRMDRDTWADSRVAGWLSEHATTTRLDISLRAEEGEARDISTLPTVVLLRSGEEIDRVRGYRGPEEVLRWLTYVETGKRWIDVVGDAAAAHGERVTREAFEDRYEYAVESIRRGRCDSAREQLLWLWSNRAVADPSSDQRVRLAGAIRKVVACDPSSAGAFRRARDESVNASLLTCDDPEADGWLELSLALDDGEGIADWLSTVDPRLCAVVRRYHDRVWEALVRAGQWSLALRVRESTVPLPVYATNRLKVSREERGLGRVARAAADQERIQELAEMYAVCLAAGREADAEVIGRTLIEGRDRASSRVWLVRRALDLGQPRSYQTRWLEEAARSGADVRELRAELMAALDRPE